MNPTNSAPLTEETLLEILPHGSGIDCKWTFDARRDEGMDCHNSFHLMDENGYYCGYADFTVRIFHHKKDVLNVLRGPCLGKTQVVHRKGDVDFKIVTHGSAWRRNVAYSLADDIAERVAFALESILTKRHETIGSTVTVQS